ncbi:hypothetical protein CRU98_06365 [Arcobacter sp. CECT 8986]|uniref:hypothetical protein n=1 Tax=Arcobacter sp. CECT 8986 TaxID=2044507 RepID=UPI001009AC45|nr:hypothetical protein [Arcobacter sp. CECT 8986]RXJ99646.1 hypothetical protein CRU98_06365 [Arcobacter sp. CECT 8986]
MIYKNEEFDLIDEFIDIGYMAEDIEVKDLDDKDLLVKKSNEKRTIQIFLSFPNYEEFKDEINFFDEFINSAKVDISTYLIFDKKINTPKFKKLITIFDTNEDFASLYGTKIVNGKYENCLTKALFIIGKDGAIYHIDMPTNLEKEFNLDVVRVELNRAYQSYTGVGCH